MCIRDRGKLYLLPRFIPGIAAVYAVMNVIKDSGSINRIAAAFGVDYKPGLLYDLKGIILSNLWFCIPFAAMMMSAALSSVNDSYVESARDAGCSWRDVLCRIILPLTYKDVIVSATFILMGQVGAFTIPYLTGPNNPKMLGILLYQQTGTYMNSVSYTHLDVYKRQRNICSYCRALCFSYFICGTVCRLPLFRSSPSIPQTPRAEKSCM